MLVGTDSVKAEHTYRGTVPRNRCGAGSHHASRPRVTRGVTGLVAQAGFDGEPAHATESVSADAALHDPGPPWAPDYGLLCEILERYGNADADMCPVEPVHSVDGPQ